VQAAYGDTPFSADVRWPRISVVVCTYNGQRTIRDCMEGVRRLRYPDLEVIVVNDGSKDQTPAIVGEYDVRLISTENHGLSAARNTGWQAATGEIVAYLDDDNAFRPDHIAKLAAALEENPEAGFAYSQILMQGNGMSYVVGVPPPSYGQIDTSAIMHRREILNLAQWRDEGQPTIDWDITERWLQAGVGWAHVPEVTADYYFT